MITCVLPVLTRLLLALRYRIRIQDTGGILSAAAADRDSQALGRNGKKGVLLLPNHPALIDPIILMAVLHRRFRPRALADENQIDRFFIRYMAKKAGVLPIPDIAKSGSQGREAIEQAVTALADYLKRGENVLLYPGGHAMRTRLEDLGGASAVERLLREVPDARIVLIRTRGLWGSSFSRAGGQEPNVAHNLSQGILSLLASGIFFAPRREVAIELYEPDDFPRQAGRRTINRYLEDFYNQDAPYNTYVPYTIWEPRGPRQLPEPEVREIEGQAEDVPLAIRQIVTECLKRLSGLEEICDTDHLARDLGLDSLARSDLLLSLEKEFGFPQGNVDSLRTVQDVLLAACGESMAAGQAQLKEVPREWFAGKGRGAAVSLPKGLRGGLPETITEAFLAQGLLAPDKAIIADQRSGVKTYRQIVAAVFALRAEIEKLPGERIGIMLPASVAAEVVYLSTLFAGKTPVMINWTVGVRNITAALRTAEVQTILTAEALMKRLRAQALDLGQLPAQLVYLEELLAGVSRWAKFRAWVRSHLSWSSLAGTKIAETAVILFTSGSETLPKVVPLSHANLLANLHDAILMFKLFDSDHLQGFLQPFHSFGLTAGALVSLCLGVPAVYHSNPAEAAMLGRLIEAYGVTILIGTPTFLNGIVRASTRKQLATLRLTVTGAEKCPRRVYDALAELCPQMVVIEGYGVTECSPIIAVNDEKDPKAGTIGKVLPSFEYAIVDADSGRRVGRGQPGVLLVQGPCVFSGYLTQEGASPFVEFEGKKWYRTGDLVSEDDDGVLTFRGRLKRFVKIGGEMISLPAIEAALDAHYPSEADEGPVIAVEALWQEEAPIPIGDQWRTQLVLFAKRAAPFVEKLDRETVNAQLRQAGLSPLHNIRRIIQLDEIPVLGTGKADYRRLREILKDLALEGSGQ